MKLGFFLGWDCVYLGRNWVSFGLGLVCVSVRWSDGYRFGLGLVCVSVGLMDIGLGWFGMC